MVQLDLGIGLCCVAMWLFVVEHAIGLRCICWFSGLQYRITNKTLYSHVVALVVGFSFAIRLDYPDVGNEHTAHHTLKCRLF